MSNKVLSFLGTTRYIECYYSYNDIKTKESCRFIQEGLLELFCREWGKDDSIIIFMTEEARNKNWLGMRESPKANFDEGLKDRLERMKTDMMLNVSIRTVMIPEGRSEDEIWKIFDIIVKEICDEDKIVFDITHSYRYLPMLTLIVLNYTRFLRDVKIEKIVYGAIEALDSIEVVKSMPIEKRIVPIFDLTSFTTLSDWIIGIERFLETGNAEMIKNLGMVSLKPLLIKTRGRSAQNIRKLLQLLNSFSKISSTCRSPQFRDTIKVILDVIPRVEEELHFLKPFAPLMEKVRIKFSKIDVAGEISCELGVASWCLEHGFIQQGLTILRESIVNYVIINILNEKNLKDKAIRDKAEKMLNDDHKEIPSSIKKLWREIIIYRNDINHAGWREDTHSPEDFERKLREFINRAFQIMI